MTTLWRRNAIIIRFTNDRAPVDLTDYLTVRERVALAHVLAADGEPLTADEIAARSGVNDSYIRAVLTDLHQAGLIMRDTERMPYTFYAPGTRCWRCSRKGTHVHRSSGRNPIWPTCAEHKQGKRAMTMKQALKEAGPLKRPRRKSA